MAHLNKEQEKASKPDGGMELVIAGAGTGKTKTLVEKVKNIVRAKNFGPENILILTFSRKAAIEIKERVKDEIGDCAEKISSGTFHSFCLNFLKENKNIFMNKYNYQKFPTLLEESKRNEIIMQLIIPNLSKFRGLPAHMVFSLMKSTSKLKNEMLEKLHEVGIVDELKYLRNSFKEVKIRNNFIEFEDMMNYSILLLKEYNKLRNKIHNRYRYLLVDEFQDTSDNNLELLKLLLPRCNANLFAVGDDWQAIYGFRDSKVEYIVNMKKYFPSVKIHKLQTNYRSKSEIVKISNNFIKRNKIRTNKKLKSFRGAGGVIKFYYIKNEKHEYNLINKLYFTWENNVETKALLYRNNFQRNRLENYNLELYNKKFDYNSMTMHSSKGLEFDEVIIMGVSDRIIPARSTDIEEERRLFYVALTRARNVLHIMIHLNEDGSLPVFGRELGLRR